MEVHHHPHAEKKSFKEYFLEFIMIFLAVTLGFFAEQIREGFVERHKEKEYAKSFYNDLTDDEKNLPHLIAWIQADIRYADSLPLLLRQATLKTSANNIYRDFRLLIRQVSIKIFVTDRTISQIKNTGEMRLLRNKEINDSLLKYYKDVDLIASLQEVALGMKARLRILYSPLLKADDWDKLLIKNTDLIKNPTDTLHLKSIDPGVINECVLLLSDLKGIHNGFKGEIIDLKNELTGLKKLISKHYNITE